MNTTKIKALILLCLMLSASPITRAYDTWGCACWLCLPMGFASAECGKARIAMIKRLFKGKSPVPSWESCQAPGVEGNGKQYTIVSKPAALMGSYQHGSLTIRPDSPIKDGVTCNFPDTGPERPRGCVTTLSSYRVHENGRGIGMIFYRDKGHGRHLLKNPATGKIYPYDKVPENAYFGLF